MSKPSHKIFPLVLLLFLSFILSSFFHGYKGVVNPIQFKEKFGIDQVSQVITVLFLIALFCERAVEVYALTFRKLKEENLERQDTPESKEELGKYKDETRKIALWAALVAGILISMIGIRGIEPFLEIVTENGVNRIKNANQWQETSLRIFDIFLTGAMIAGGSDTIHKILKVFTTFMDTAAISSKAQANNIQPITAKPTVTGQ
jgi:hypothetical protein